MKRKAWPPAVFIIGYTLITAVFSTALVFFNWNHVLLMPLMAPVVLSIFYYKMRVYLPLWLAFTSCLFWVVSRLTGPPLTSILFALGVACLILLLICEAIYRLALSQRKAEQALGESSALNRTLLTVTPDLLFRIDKEGKYLDIRPARNFDPIADPQAFNGKHVFEMLPPEAARQRMEAIQRALETGEIQTYEYPLALHGEQRFYEAQIVPIGGDEVIAAIRDITERRSAEESLVQYARELAALYETSLEINSQPDLSDLLNAIMVRATSLLGTNMGALYLLDPDGQTLQLKVAHRLPRLFSDVVLRLGDGLAGRVAQSGQMMMVRDYSTWPGRVQALRDNRIHRALGVPLKVEKQVIGVVVINDDQRVGDFNSQEVRLAGLFADQAALAIQNRRLFETAQKELAERNRSETALRESEERLQQVLQQMPYPVEVSDTEGTALLVNQAFLDLFGLPSKEMVIGKHNFFKDWVILEDLGLREQIQRAYAGEMVFVPEITMPLNQLEEMYDPSANLAVVELTMFPVFKHSGELGQVVSIWKNITERKQAEEKLTYLSTHDALTGIYNRAYFEVEMQRLQESRLFPVSLLLADIDGLKEANDRFGHSAGDALLRRAGQALAAAFRAEDIVARIGGDEFGVLLVETDARAAALAVERVRQAVTARNAETPELHLQLSLGVATAQKGENLVEVLKQADKAMYQEKKRRKRNAF